MDKTKAVLLVVLFVSLALNLYQYMGGDEGRVADKRPLDRQNVYAGFGASSSKIRDRTPDTEGVDVEESETIGVAEAQQLFEEGRYIEALAALDRLSENARESRRAQWLKVCMQWILEDPQQPRIGSLITAGLQANQLDMDFRQLLVEHYIGQDQLTEAVDLLYTLINESDPELQGIFASRLQLLFSDTIKHFASLKAWQPMVDFSERLLWHESGHVQYIMVHARALANLKQYQMARSGLLNILHDEYYGAQAKELLDKIDRLNAGEGQVTLTRHGAHHIASAVINGRHKASLMIDTGASVSVLTRKFFQQQMAGSSPAFIRTEKMNTAGGEVMADVYRVNSLQLDKFMVSDIEIAVIDIDSVGGSDGLLGMNFLRHFEFAIDQKYNVLTLSSQP